MLVDANLLLFAADKDSPFHPRASDWLTKCLNGTRRVGIPWQSLTAFLRITTHPRASDHPLTPRQAWCFVAEWLACEIVWTPEPGSRYSEILGNLIATHNIHGNLIPDAQLAALALEYGLTVYSADTDFARFPEISWNNPVTKPL